MRTARTAADREGASHGAESTPGLGRPRGVDSSVNLAECAESSRSATIALAALTALPDVAPADEPRVPIPPDHYTKAELHAFRSIATYDEVIAFCGRLAKTSPSLKLDFFGTSGQGRKMPVVFVSKEKEFSPNERGRRAASRGSSFSARSTAARWTAPRRSWSFCATSP